MFRVAEPCNPALRIVDLHDRRPTNFGAKKHQATRPKTDRIADNSGRDNRHSHAAGIILLLRMILTASPLAAPLNDSYMTLIGAGWSSPVARQAHNLKVVGSNPTPATNPAEKIHLISVTC